MPTSVINYAVTRSTDVALKLVHSASAILLVLADVPARAKTAVALLTYRPNQIKAIIGNADNVPCMLQTVPVYSSVAEAVSKHHFDVAVVGVTAQGTEWPAGLADSILSIARNGLTVVSGLHPRFDVDNLITIRAEPEWARSAPKHPPVVRPSTRLVTMGSDTNIGKFITAYELHRAARARGVSSHFVATGQTGMMVSGNGICLDTIAIDFAVQALRHTIERLTCADGDLLIVEGQGSFAHPDSIASLAVLRGSSATHIIYVHRPGLLHNRDYPYILVPRLQEHFAIIEGLGQMAGGAPRCRVVGVSVDTSAYSPERAAKEMNLLSDELGLPVCDPLRCGVDKLVTAVLETSDLVVAVDGYTQLPCEGNIN